MRYRIMNILSFEKESMRPWFLSSLSSKAFDAQTLHCEKLVILAFFAYKALKSLTHLYSSINDFCIEQQE